MGSKASCCNDSSSTADYMEQRSESNDPYSPLVEQLSSAPQATKAEVATYPQKDVGGAPPAPQKQETFEIVVDRSQGARLGIDVEQGDTASALLTVGRVNPGLIDE